MITVPHTTAQYSSFSLLLVALGAGDRLGGHLIVRMS